MHRRAFLIGAITGGVTAIAGCISGSTDETGAIVDETVRLTTTTSTYDTGLLIVVNEAFESRFGAAVDAIAQGTGAALQTGRNGDADLVMVHARTLEDDFIADGYGINRRDVMFNDFILLGPPSDPAEVAGVTEASEALSSIASSESTFISRGDNSGTHLKERELWERAGTDPSGSWYREVGSGMGTVLTQANLTDEAYTLSDRGTYLAMRSGLNTLSIVVEGPIRDGPSVLANPYGIVAVNPAVHPAINYDLAMAYIGFLTSPTGQQLIEDFTIDGEQLFFPDAIASNPNFQQYVPEDWDQG